MTCGSPAEATHELLHDGTTGGAHGFIIKEVGGPVYAALHADTAFYPASVIKLVHMAHALRTTAPEDHPVAVDFEDGCRGTGPGVERPVYDLLAAMMQVSDNAAANALQTHFGLDALETTIDEAGMAATRLVHGFGCGGPANDPANRTTAIDLIHLLEAIADGTLVPSDRWSLVEEMMLDVTSATGFDPATGAVVLAKDGWYGTTLTLGGLARIPTKDGTRTFLFAAFTDGATSVDPSFTILSVARELLDSWRGN
jgi:beta-lactamase class A